MRKLSIYFLLIIFAATFLTSCKKDPVVNLLDGKTVTVDATSYDTWTYFSLSTGEVVTVTDAATDTNWDLGFLRSHIRTNSGTSGNGQGGAYDAGVVDFESVTEALETGYATDVDDEVTQFNMTTFEYEDISANAVLETWGSFDTSVNPPPFTVADRIFVVKTADSKYAKIHVKAYSNENGTGNITFEYKFQTDGTTNIE